MIAVRKLLGLVEAARFKPSIWVSMVRWKLFIHSSKSSLVYRENPLSILSNSNLLRVHHLYSANSQYKPK